MNTNPKWEYKLLVLHAKVYGWSIAETEDKLNEYGNAGWELVTQSDNALIFKRMKTDESKNLA